MKLIRGTYNRIRFLFTKLRLKGSGKCVLFESPYEVEGASHIVVGANVRSKPRLHLAAIDHHNKIEFTPEIIIGDEVSINYDVHIACINRIEIGKGTLIASRVFITDHSHGSTSLSDMKLPPSNRTLYSKGPVIIGENVWIGEGVAIMPGVKIGNNSIVGANAVVTRDVPPFSIAVGIPAKIISSQ